jgi:hypothetical protein
LRPTSASFCGWSAELGNIRDLTPLPGPGLVLKPASNGAVCDAIVLHRVGHSAKSRENPYLLNFRPLHAKCNLRRGDNDFFFLNHSFRNNPTLWGKRAWRNLEL